MSSHTEGSTSTGDAPQQAPEAIASQPPAQHGVIPGSDDPPPFTLDQEPRFSGGDDDATDDDATDDEDDYTGDGYDVDDPDSFDLV